MSTPAIPIAIFRLGRIVATPCLLKSINQDEILAGIRRHQAGDWGDLREEDRRENDLCLNNGGRLLSVYHSAKGVKFYIITEADRSATTVLMPEDY